MRGLIQLRQMRSAAAAAGCACALAAPSALDPASAEAAVSCNFSAPTLTVSITAGGTTAASVVRTGTDIKVTENSPPSDVTCTGTTPSVSNTAGVVVTDTSGAGSNFTIDLVAGAFTPGTPLEEPGSSSEIEFSVDLGSGSSDFFRILGSPGAVDDNIRLGAVATTPCINLNAPEPMGPDCDDVSMNGVEQALVLGGAGNDTISAAGTTPEFTGGFPIVFAQINGEGGSDVLTASDVGNILDGGPGTNTLTGGAAGDNLRPYAAGSTDTVDGNGGDDFLDYIFSNGPVTVDLRDTGPQDTGSAGTDTLSDIESIAGGDGTDDVLIGTNGFNIIVGGELPGTTTGDDLMLGLGGDDAFTAGAGNDTASYAAGSTSGITLDLQTTAPQPTGGAGTDTFFDGSDPDSLPDVENVIGSPFADTLTGNSVANAFDIRDGGPDTVTCLDPPPPPPADSVVADMQGVDTINADCEQVDFLPTPEPPPPVDDADSTPPDTQIGKGPKKKSKKKQATFEFSSTEAGSTFQCNLDGKGFQPCSSPFTTKVKKGKHEFEVRATDAAGNTDPTPAEQGWKVKKKR